MFKGLNVKTGDFVAIKRMSLRNVDMDEIESMQVPVQGRRCWGQRHGLATFSLASSGSGVTVFACGGRMIAWCVYRAKSTC